MYIKFVSYKEGEAFNQTTIEASEVDSKELTPDGLALGQVLVTTRKDGVEQTHSLSTSSWHTCFIMNSEGKTIDRLFAPAETNSTKVAA